MSSVLRRRRLPIAILIGGLALSFGLAAGSRVLFDQSEDRLLQQRTNEAGSALQIGVNAVKAPLDAAAKLAEATDGDLDAFAQVIGPVVGTGTGKSYAAVALFRVGDTTPIRSWSSTSSSSGPASSATPWQVRGATPTTSPMPNGN